MWIMWMKNIENYLFEIKKYCLMCIWVRVFFIDGYLGICYVFLSIKIREI